MAIIQTARMPPLAISILTVQVEIQFLGNDLINIKITTAQNEVSEIQESHYLVIIATNSEADIDCAILTVVKGDLP